MNTYTFHPIKFRLARIKAGLGRGELAKKAKVSASTIKAWEAGRRWYAHGPSLVLLRRCAVAMGHSGVSRFMGPEDWEPTEEEKELLLRNLKSTRAGYHHNAREPRVLVSVEMPRGARQKIESWDSDTQSLTQS